VVGAGVVADESLLEVQPAVDASGWQVFELGAGGADQHEGRLAHSLALVVAVDSKCGGVVQQPVLRLGDVVVLGGVPWELEAFDDWLAQDSWPEALGASGTFFFCNAGFHESVDAVSGISWLDTWAQPGVGRLALAAGCRSWLVRAPVRQLVGRVLRLLPAGRWPASAGPSTRGRGLCVPASMAHASMESSEGAAMPARVW
jgi:hypothetical protein